MKKMKKLLLLLMIALSLTAPSTVPLIGTVESIQAAAQINKKSAVLLTGQTLQLKVKNADNTVKWSSNNKTVAVVKNNGVVTAKKKGTAVITAKTGKSVLQCKVTVQAPRISSTAQTVSPGKSIRLTVSGTNQKVTWKSSNPRVASVSASGIVVAKSAGSCKIYATVLGRKFACTITVKTPQPSVSAVWLSATGSKYHKIPNCGRMNPNKATKVTLTYAKQCGYSACSKCFR
ncbi:MAG: Ig-like domain-containing protein [Eubacteriales bacterium]|nr:Ig-like domain-containing protein [Eubacteriales bacterium]